MERFQMLTATLMGPSFFPTIAAINESPATKTMPSTRRRKRASHQLASMGNGSNPSAHDRHRCGVPATGVRR